MPTENQEYNYNAVPDAIPYILEKDWNLTLADDLERDIAIRIFILRYAEPRQLSNSLPVDEWFVQDSSRFGKGYFNGQISFSLKKEDISFFRVMLCLAKIVVCSALKQDLAMSVITTGELAALTTRICSFSEAPRCLLLRAVELTNNHSSIAFRREDLHPVLDQEQPCERANYFSCNCYQENSCMLRPDKFEKAVDLLLERKAIYEDAHGMYHIS